MQYLDQQPIPAVLPVVEFLAGKCNWDGKIVTPDKRKGKLVLGNGEDTLLRVQWICRTSNRVEENLIVINDAYLERVKAAKTGRVYLLRFTSSDKKLLFWLQDADTSKDEENIAKFNAIIGAGIPSNVNASGEVATPAETAVPGNEAPTETNAARAAAETPAVTEPSNASLRSNRTPAVCISNMLHGCDELKKLLADESTVEELKEFLPESLKPPFEDEMINKIVHSPQLRRCAELISGAIYSDRLPFLISSMDIPSGSLESSLNSGALRTFVEGLENSTPSETPAAASTPPATENRNNETSEENGQAKNDSLDESNDVQME